MRARIAVLSVFMVVFASGVFVAYQRVRSTVRAQGAEPAPLFVNEVRRWCPSNDDGFQTPCDSAIVETLHDGALRVVLNALTDESGTRLADVWCVPGIAVPADVTGWAYVIRVGQDSVVDTKEIASTDYVCELVVTR